MMPTNYNRIKKLANGGDTDDPPAKRSMATEPGGIPARSSLLHQGIRSMADVALPHNAAQLVAHLITGDQNYGLKDSTPGARHALTRAALASMARTGKNQGQITYEDYGEQMPSTIEHFNASKGEAMGASAMSIDFRAATEFGKAGYSYDPETGDIKFTDRYDWNKVKDPGEGYGEIRAIVGDIAPNMEQEKQPPQYIGQTNVNAYNRTKFLYPNTYDTYSRFHKANMGPVDNVVDGTIDGVIDIFKGRSNIVNNVQEQIQQGAGQAQEAIQQGANQLQQGIGQVRKRLGFEDGGKINTPMNHRYKRVKKMAAGGGIEQGISSIAPLLNFLPGVGQLAAPMMGALAPLFGAMTETKPLIPSAAHSASNLNIAPKSLANGGPTQSHNVHGGLLNFNGPSHAKGGIPFQGVEVEGGETNWKDYVFSDRLKYKHAK